MSWTVWQRRTRCQDCGARIPVPPDGLYMTCEYCGTKAPVPDMEARLKAQEHAAHQARGAEKARRRAAEGRRAESLPRQQRRRGAGTGLFIIIFVLVIFAFTSWTTGLVKVVLRQAGLGNHVRWAEPHEAGEPQKAGGAARQQARPAAARPKKQTRTATTRRRPRRKKSTRKEAAKPEAPRPVGPTPSLNPPPREAAPRGAPPPYEVPGETDLERALEDDDL